EEEHWVPEDGAGQGLVQRLWQEGLAGPLQWLETYLKRTAGDREEDGVSHPVPLVPLSEDNEDAMEDRRFQALLRKLGLRPPASEQESFWRIPAALTPQQLRRAAASLDPQGPRPQGSPRSPPGQLSAPPHPQGPAPAPCPSNPCPHCYRDEPGPAQAGTKRRWQMDSDDEDTPSLGELGPLLPPRNTAPPRGLAAP
ncbi:TIM protein, partial [Dromaius novaehollandiae]|nr:TIM protein [Dromaius novaehollandiae]